MHRERYWSRISCTLQTVNSEVGYQSRQPFYGAHYVHYTVIGWKKNHLPKRQPVLPYYTTSRGLKPVFNSYQFKIQKMIRWLEHSYYLNHYHRDYTFLKKKKWWFVLTHVSTLRNRSYFYYWRIKKMCSLKANHVSIILQFSRMTENLQFRVSKFKKYNLCLLFS